MTRTTAELRELAETIVSIRTAVLAAADHPSVEASMESTAFDLFDVAVRRLPFPWGWWFRRKIRPQVGRIADRRVIEQLSQLRDTWGRGE
ncbi:hypothetical protein [Agromyces sp. SYSU T00194]|uniref:hypothetical protein n=1 Tax=Agromyces chitinivorans TaxID=3158560 RepID=UPI00339B3EA3